MESAGDSASHDRRRLRWVWAAALLLWLLVAIPLATGDRTLFLRDVFASHLQLKAFGAEQLQEGRIPAFNPTWGAGQPFRGNPNTVAFYPGNLLYLVLPFWSAFNLHYALHWLLALLAMFALARELGQRRAAALVAGLTWAGGGWVLGAMTFYNLLTVSAWWPLVMLGGRRGGWAGVGLGGAACGMALLGGEPVTATLGLVPLLWIAIDRWGWRRGVLQVGAIGTVGLLVALPQLVATLRVLGHTVRGVEGAQATPGLFALHPLRMLELLVALPWGWVADLGALQSMLAPEASPRPPYVLSLSIGAVGLWLALAGASRRRGWAVLALGGYLLAWLGGPLAPFLAKVSAGLFRYPEKFLLWPALVLPLLAGWGVEVVRQRPLVWRKVSLALALVAVLLLVVVAMAQPDLEGPVPRAAWIWPLLASGITLLLATWACRSGWRPAALAGLALAALVVHAPLIQTDSTEPYRIAAPWAERLGAGASVVNSTYHSPYRHPPPRYRLGADPIRQAARLGAATLEPAPGVLHGLRYPLGADLEGMHSPPFGQLLDQAPYLDWPQRLRWMRALGVDAAVLIENPAVEGLRLIEGQERLGAATYLFAVEDTAPRLRWPERLVPIEDPRQALQAVARLADPASTVIVPSALAHVPGAELRLVEEAPDRLVFEVEGQGGLAVWARAYQPALRARAGDQELPTVLVDGALLGIEVPPGRHRVEVKVGAGPEILAALLAGLSLIAALGLAVTAPKGFATMPAVAAPATDLL